ncbi:hypothetical protein BDR04DRAFT_1226565 [Suillus decipiens]|nr:hypothetical protein BDR04DRAFT_1226565 [Suillus decipiens]
MVESPETLLAILQTLYPHGSTVTDFYDPRRDLLLKYQHPSKKSKGTVALLDAVAAISIQDARSQAIAVSITVNQNKCIIHITGNNGVNEETLSHLRYVFTQLKSIRASLAQPLEAGTKTLDTLTPKKFRQRVVKRQTLFETEVIPCMAKFADEQRGSWTSEEASDYQKFEDVVFILSNCFKWAKLDPQDEKEMRRMIEDESTSSRITSWEMEIMKRSGSGLFPLRRYLSKVFSLSYHFVSLLTNVAYSHRMGHVLDALIIERIDPVSESNTFTLSKDVIRQIVMGSGVTDNDAIEEATSSIISAFPSSFTDAKFLTRSITNKIHCEALLLRYHSLNPPFPPFNYIGVSKLSCYPCYALFHAFNKSVGQGHKYFVKGCHKKLYRNWILPKIPLLNPSILAKECFRVALIEWLNMRSDSRCNSDSTGVSTTSCGTELECSYTDTEVSEYFDRFPP